jgi:uncharacterized protein
VSGVLKSIGVFLLWNLVAGGVLIFVPFPFGLLGALALAGALIWGYVLAPAEGARRWATLRLREVEPASLRWVALSIPVLLLLSWALGDVYLRLVPVPAESLNPFEAIMRTPQGRLSITIFAVAVAPLIEEFFFRGLIQRELERRHGAVVGITGASTLFAMVHFLPWVFPLHFTLGIVFGFAVYATRSIWAGVILHAANNAAAVIGIGFGDPDLPPTGGFWDVGPTVDLWLSVATLVASVLLAVWTARRLWESSRPARLRSA